MRWVTENGFVMIATISQSGTNSITPGRFRNRGSRASLNCAFGATSPATSSNSIERDKSARQRAGTRRALTANVRAWAKITAQAIPVDDGMRSTKRSQFLGECRNMLAGLFARGLLLNMSIDTDPHLQKAASRQGVVVRSSSR